MKITKLKLVLTSAAIAAFSVFPAAAPARAGDCGDDLDETCAVVATVVCKILAKGQPCLN